MTGAPSETISALAERGFGKGLDQLFARQRPRGEWLGEVKWNTVLSSQYVIVSYLTGQPVDGFRRDQLLRHFELQRTCEGAWGLHDESAPYVFSTTLAYVALRILGLSATDSLPRGALAWLKAHGGVLGIPTWGKFWLALINLYGWEGINPISPELWLLPRWWPAHPRRLYNHTRLIYLAMAYLYGRRFSAVASSFVRALRSELYDEPYEQVAFSASRSKVAASDLFAPPSKVLQPIYAFLRWVTPISPPHLRHRALDACFDQIVFELRASNYVSLSPINGLLTVLALHDQKHVDFSRAYEGINYWYWQDETEGMRSGGAHSHTWDTAFVIRASLTARDRLTPHQLGRSLRRAYHFLRDSQILTEVGEDRVRCWRARDCNRGGWCFSDEIHAWPVSDCTGEVLRAMLELDPFVPDAERMIESKWTAAADFILSRQNSDGGFGSFERRHGPTWLELLNASEMFAGCMVDGSYVECTASCIGGLAGFQRRFPEFRRKQIDRAIKHGVRWLLAQQRADGSWEGAWGVNFIYATYFSIEGLLTTGLPAHHPAVQRASGWLLDRQMSDGGWGEHWNSCLSGEYCVHPQSQVIMTAWALLALLRIGDQRARPAVERGIRWLLGKQFSNGDFPEQSPAGVFFRTGLLHYRLYKNYFPLWAIAAYLRAAGGKAFV